MTGISPNAADLEAAFAIEVFDMLKKERKISHIVIDNMNTWQHSGFNVYCGPPVELWDDEGLERLAQYIVRAPFSQERIGNSGTGKTHIVTAIGMEAIRKGYSVRFRRACDLVTQLSEAKSEKHLSTMLKSLNKCQLLVLDELGYLTLDQKSSNHTSDTFF